MCKTRLARALLALGCALSVPVAMQAQYFGQNKVRHKELQFEVLKTEHFDLYFYPSERAAAVEAGRLAERWYVRLGGTLNHVLTTRQPIILYASHTDFEQSPVVPGMIGEGTGGVTLSIGRKVVLPLAGTLAETDHVLGHELVHAYQYDMTTSPASSTPGAAHMPLWFIEGMAEYLSLGPKDANTAMWMRDAVARDQFPAIKDLDSGKYFPYRYGEAFWAFVGGRFGDDKIGPLLLAADQAGNLNGAFEKVLHVSEKQLSAEWKQATIAANQPVLNATQAVNPANVLVAARKNLNGLNVSPAVSPDGKWVMFFSERGLFSIELYLADAHTGKVVRKITATAVSSHFNNLEFINSVGAWSGDSQQFAFGHVEGAKASISVYDMAKQQVVRQYPIPNVGEIFSPTWSPDGHQIAFSAIYGGLANLYVLNLDTGAVRRLTNDGHAELAPAWSPDGTRIALVTDRFTSNLTDLSHGQYKLGLYDLNTGTITQVAAAGGGSQTNPQWSPDGQELYYLSNATGIPDIYRVNLSGGSPQQITNLQTGVSGITALSPAFSVAGKTGAIIYSTFRDNTYSLVQVPPSPPTVNGAAVAALHPAVLAPRTSDNGLVANYLQNWNHGLVEAASFTNHPYRPTLRLEYVAPPSIGIGVSSYGTQVGGGTAFVFSDLLAYHSLTIAAQSLAFSSDQGGFLRNLSGNAVYMNDRHRWSWGFGGGQTPVVTGGYNVATGVVNGVPVAREQTVTQWELDRQAVGLFAYPFSRAQRLEFTAGYENIGFAAASAVDTFDLATGQLLASQKTNLPAPPGLNFGIATGALVYDTSVFGGVSPILGQSYRFQAGMNAGTIDFATALVDYRKYISLARPVSVAGRFLHYGRYGSGADNSLTQPLFLGYPTIVRGYDFNSIQPAECGPNFQATGVCPLLNRLVGSKIAAVSAELRFEVLGPLGVWRTPMIPPVEIAPFFDAGTAWSSADKPNFLGGSVKPVSSEGVVMRANLLGYAVLSVDYALPNNRPLRKHVWEFTLQPGF